MQLTEDDYSSHCLFWLVQIKVKVLYYQFDQFVVLCNAFPYTVYTWRKIPKTAGNVPMNMEKSPNKNSTITTKHVIKKVTAQPPISDTE